MKIQKNLFYIIVLLLSAFSIFSFLKKDRVSAQELKYKEIEVQRGDTLWSISKEYNKSSLDIRKYIFLIEEKNNIQNSNIQTGDVLYIPIIESGR